MSARRQAYLDASPGEVRGVVTLDGRPERLLIARDGAYARLCRSQILLDLDPAPKPQSAASTEAA